jgi:CRISPR-associated endonuclease/helicase Cas3
LEIEVAVENDFIAHYLGPDNKSQSVLKHLEEVSKFASIFASKIGLPLVGELVGLLHDFGKYSKYFQNYIRSAEGMLDPDEEPIDSKKLKGKIDHSTAGAQLVWDALKERDGLSRLVAQVVSLCVASHHSGLLDCLSPDGEDKFSGRMAKKDGQTHLNEARRVADKVVLDKVFNLLDSSSCGIELKNQLERLFDGEKSQEIREFYLGFLARSLFSTLIDADRLSAAGHVGHGVNAPRWELLVERLERYISGIEQRSWLMKFAPKSL